MVQVCSPGVPGESARDGGRSREWDCTATATRASSPSPIAWRWWDCPMHIVSPPYRSLVRVTFSLAQLASAFRRPFRENGRLYELTLRTQPPSSCRKSPVPISSPSASLPHEMAHPYKLALNTRRPASMQELARPYPPPSL